MSSARINVNIKDSDSSDLSAANRHESSESFTGVNVNLKNELPLTTTEKRILLDNFNGDFIKAVAFESPSTNSTNLIVEFWTKCGTWTGSVDLTFNAGPDTITDAGTTGTFITSGAGPDRWVRITDSASNDSYYQINSTTTNVITLDDDEATGPVETGVSVTLDFLSKNTIMLEPGETALVHNVWDGDTTEDIKVQALSGTPVIRYSILPDA